jgi:hypothetical protein
MHTLTHNRECTCARKREKSTTPGLVVRYMLETRAAWNVFWNSKWGCDWKGCATCSVNGAADLNGTWGVRSSAAQTLGKHPSFAFPLFQPYSAQQQRPARVIRFLVTINMRGRFQKSLPLLYSVSRFMECFYIALMLSELWCKVHALLLLGNLKTTTTHERRSRSRSARLI